MKRFALLAAFPAILLGLLLTVILLAVSVGGISAASCPSSGSVVAAAAGVNLDTTGIRIAGQPISSLQAADAETIIGVAEARGLDRRDTLIVVMIGLQETKLTNPDSGSGDSLGIFQQSPGNGWGTPEQIMDVGYAANRLIDRLEQVAGRDSMSLLDVALAVQHPSRAAYLSPANYFPDWQPVAEQILDQTTPLPGSEPPGTASYTTVCAVVGPPDGRVDTAVKFALSVLGTPYVWGGETETGGFDCSGLVWWAFSQAGFPVQRTTAAGEYDWGEHVSLDQLQRGDLVFWAYDVNDPATIHHVAIYLGDGQIVAAPHSGDVVKVESLYDTDHIIGGTRLVQAAAKQQKAG